MNPDCPFCGRMLQGSLLIATDLAVAFDDGFPLTTGHTLVVPRTHTHDLFALGGSEQQAVWSLVAAVRGLLAYRYGPDGFNVGLNLGAAAGQTVEHAHVHVIPRYVGDVPDPRGGVRWVIPDRAAYWR